MTFINSLGDIQYPIWIVLILMLVQIARCTAQLIRGEGPVSPLRTHSILVFGTLGACLGVLGTLLGVANMANVIGRAGGVSSATAWEGVGITIAPSILGFAILGTASIAWLVLQYATARRAR